jgi:hypothetical protein
MADRMKPFTVAKPLQQPKPHELQYKRMQNTPDNKPPNHY